MPMYQFKCTKCDHEFEDVVPLEEKDKMKCPQCNEKAETLIVNPKHFKHVSWSSWRVDHNKD